MHEVNPIAGALGAEIQGFDLSSELSDENHKQLRGLLNRHEVIFFRDQNISPARQKGPRAFFWPFADASGL